MLALCIPLSAIYKVLTYRHLREEIHESFTSKDKVHNLPYTIKDYSFHNRFSVHDIVLAVVVRVRQEKI